jgi:GNAT superfamily N-acetyltransferase
VSGKGVEVAALSAMVRFFLEARTWDSESPAEVLAQTHALVRRRLPGASFASVFIGFVSDGVLRWSNAGQAPPVVLRAGAAPEELMATGLPLGIEEEPSYGDRTTRLGPGDVLFAHTDGLTEARRDGRFFGEERLPALLAEHGLALAPAALVARVREELEAWAPRLDDDVVVLAARAVDAVVEVRAERADDPAGRALWEEYLELVRARLGTDFVASEAIFGTDEAFDPPDGAWIVVYEDGRPVACGGLREVGAGVVELKRMFVTARARGRGHGRRVLVELEARARARGARRARLLTTEALGEARRLYASAGYRIAAEELVGARRDLWLEKEL